RAIRARVQAEESLTCSVGVAATKFVAKLASTRCKPDGMLVVPADGALDFLHPLPVEALWGVGERTAGALARLGLRTGGGAAGVSAGRGRLRVGALAALPLPALRRAVGDAHARHLHELAWARDPR